MKPQAIWKNFRQVVSTSGAAMAGVMLVLYGLALVSVITAGRVIV
ncbi:MAG: hypothetical protein ACON4V_04485 [Parvibaculales bacterium]